MRLLNRLSVPALLLSAVFSVPLMAADVVWNLTVPTESESTTGDDGSLTGTFTYDATLGQVSTWSVSVNGGGDAFSGSPLLPSFTYNPTTSTVSYTTLSSQVVMVFTCKVTLCPLVNGNPRRLFMGPFAYETSNDAPLPLTDAGGIRSLELGTSGNHEEYDVTTRALFGWVGAPVVVIGPLPPVIGQPGKTTTPGSPSPTTSVVTRAILDTVNTGSGNHFVHINDIVTPGKGLHFVFSRSYNGLDPYSGPLCQGWTHSYNLVLTVNPDTFAVKIKEGDGTENTFSLVAGAYTAPSGDFDVLTKVGSDYFLKRPNQTVFRFGPVPLNFLLIRLLSITDKNGNQQTLTYDALGNLVTFTDLGSKTYAFAYDVNNHLVSLTDNQLTRTFQYACDTVPTLTSFTDAAGKTTHYNYAGGKLTASTDPLTNTQITSNYDSSNRVVSTTKAGFCTTSYLYDDAAHSTTVTDPLGGITKYFFDPQGRLTKTINALGFTTKYTYDPSTNLLLTTTNPLGAVTTYQYDGHGNRTKIIDPLGHTTTMGYDGNNNMTSQIDANGRQTVFAYDGNNNLTQVTDALGGITKYEYASLPKPKTKTTNAKNANTLYTYDSSNHLLTSKDPLLNVTTYTYDSAGRLLSQLEPELNKKNYGYDVLGRLVSVAYTAGNLAPAGPVTYTYDANGNRTSMSDPTGTTSYLYDSLNRVTQISSLSGIVTYAYDCNNNRTQMTYAGKIVSYAYDALNRLTTVTDGTKITRYTYDAADNLLSITYPNHSGVTFTYDLAGRTTRVGNFYANGGGNSISSFQYLLDSVGNRINVNGSGLVYDKLNRLFSSSPNSLIYDAVGNRTAQQAPSANINYSYDLADNLLTSGGTTYIFDKNGNLKTSKIGKNPTTYVFDAANRLISVTGPGGNNTFTYDGDGNRVSQKVGSSTYKYLSDIATGFATVLDETGPDGHIQYVRGRGLISATSPAFTFFYHYDAQASVVGLTDPTGKVVKHYDYDVWGTQTSAIPTSNVGTQNKWAYTGEAMDPGTNLIYLRARYYDPTTGRFLSRDPFVGYDRAPLTLHRFIYTRDNPGTLTDRTGLYSDYYLDSDLSTDYTAYSDSDYDYGYDYASYYDYDFFFDAFSEPLWPGAPPLP